MIGDKIYNLAKDLWKIDRSITGDGVRKTLSIIKNKHLPQLSIFEVPSGHKVLDWTVPKEWRIKDAYIITPSKQKICDFKINNLHILGYSKPIHKKMQLDELNQNLYSLENQPDAIPYVTSYYTERWGFCLSHRERLQLPEGEYEVFIDSELFDGSLTYGELIIPGEQKEEVFLSTYVCHPSMANNELSGPSVTTFLAEWLMSLHKKKYTYRIIFIPETIGSITYLSKNLDTLKANVIAGFNITCVGDNRTYSYLPSRNGNTLSDIIAKHVLKWIYPHYKSYKWKDRGSDERQYCAPGIDLPIASIMRSKYGEYPEYHTSLDNLNNVVTPEGLAGSYNTLKNAIEAIENNYKPKVSILGEPQLGKRGLYPTLSIKNNSDSIKTLMNLITYSDGTKSLVEIAEECDVPIWELYPIINKLLDHNLLIINK
ncbi:DUF4910 domain-containing protein [Fluviispira vulneris]|uniref:DUF4910 domain-containing protein n=1 Tax=Fluviispira vulneris TaxID=2763012 RepID=UPI0016473142|nr:DUF4910 domain-containing protein [Fluviispira vulneris]